MKELVAQVKGSAQGRELLVDGPTQAEHLAVMGRSMICKELFKGHKYQLQFDVH